MRITVTLVILVDRMWKSLPASWSVLMLMLIMDTVTFHNMNPRHPKEIQEMVKLVMNSGKVPVTKRTASLFQMTMAMFSSHKFRL